MALLLAVLATGAGAAEKAKPVTVPDFRFINPVKGIQAAAREGGLKLEGMDPAPAREAMNPGDSVSVLVSWSNGPERKQWLFVLTMEEPTAKEKMRPHDRARMYASSGHEFRFDGGRAGIRMAMVGPVTPTTTAGSGIAIRHQRILVDSDFLALGLERAPAMWLRARARKAADPSLPDGGLGISFTPYPAAPAPLIAAKLAAVGITEADERAFAGSVLALREFFFTASRTPGLDEVLKSVLDVPWWAIVLRGGHLDLNLQTLPFDQELNAHDWGIADEKVFASSYVLTINKKPALLFQLALTAPKPPLTVCAGIIGFAAVAPDGKGPLLTFQVVASQATPATP